VRVKIGCRDMRKVPAIVECLLDLYFYDFTFVREVPSEVAGTSTGNKWTRSTDRPEEDSPSPKKSKWGERSHHNEISNPQSNTFVAGNQTVSKEKGKKIAKG